MAAGPNLAGKFENSPKAFRRALTAVIVFLLIWELCGRAPQWFGFKVPGLSEVPPPSLVFRSWLGIVGDPGYWLSWLLSFARVMGGFLAALALGVPFGLMLAASKTFRGLAFPVFEVIRPIPPLAWVPAAIIFWPTQESAIMFITFLGAFFTIVINVFGGAQTIDPRFVQAARSLGASRGTVFRRVTLPATLPSIIIGSATAIGITWEVVVAAEMISGSSKLSATAGGLGHFIWSSYLGGAYEQIIVGMISIGIAGYLCSAGVRWVGDASMRWLGQR